MKRSRCWPFAAGVMISIVYRASFAAGPVPSVDTVLAEWQEASTTYRTLAAKLIVFRYDVFHGRDLPEISRGRFFYETPDFARYDLFESDNGKGQDSPRPSHSVVFTTEGLFLVNHRDKSCEFWSAQAIAEVRRKMEEMPERTAWDRFLKGYMSLFTAPAEFSKPDDFMPLFLNANTQAQLERFKIRVEDRDGGLVVVAVPKQNSPVFREINVMLERKSYRLVAHRVVTTSGEETVRVFDSLKINSPPPDRDILLKPVPSGYRVVRMEELLLSQTEPPTSTAR